MQLELLAVGGLVDAVGIERALERLAALLEIGGQRAVHQAERIAVDQHLVLGIDRRDAVFHVEDGRDRRFQDHVGDASRIVLADHVGAVDFDLDMHAVVDQQHRARRGGIALEARELRARFQRGGVAALQLDRELAGDDAVRGHIGVASGRQRHGGIEKRLGLGDHLVAARLVVALAGFARVVRDRIGAVECIVKAAPARIGGVQRIARIGQRHHQLRSADLADLLVDVGCLDLLRRRFRQEIADLLEERGVGIHVERLALVGAMPAVDFRLQAVADRQQLTVPGSQIAQDGGKPGPEAIRGNSGLGGGFLGDEIEQNGGDFQSVGIDTIHDGIFSRETAAGGRFSGGKRQKGPAKGLVRGPFSPKAGAMRRPLAALFCPLRGRPGTLRYWRRGR